MIKREKNATFAFAQLLVSCLGRAFNISSRILEAELANYGVELYQEKYTTEYKDILERKIFEKKRQLDERARLMQRLDALEISDEDFKEMMKPLEKNKTKTKIIR